MRIIFLLSVMTFWSCKPVKNQSVVKIEPQKSEGELLPVKAEFEEYFVSDYDLYRFEDNKFIGKDTLMELKNEFNQVVLKGKFAINEKNEISDLKIGNHQFFYPDQSIESEGEYRIGSYLMCGAGGVFRQFYNFKKGIWNYYHPNGEVYVHANFEIGEYKINTSCQGGDSLLFGRIDEFKLYDQEGIQQSVKDSLVDKYSAVANTLFGEGVYYLHNGLVKFK